MRFPPLVAELNEDPESFVRSIIFGKVVGRVVGKFSFEGVIRDPVPFAEVNEVAESFVKSIISREALGPATGVRTCF